jgi:hypothetical protein
MSGTLGGPMGGAVDSSIALQAGRGVQQPNPLQQIGQFAATQNLLNQNRLFPGQMALQGQQVQGGQVSLNQHINQAAAAAMAPLLTAPDGRITHAMATNQIATGEAQGIPMSNAVAALATLPQGDGPGFDKAYRAWVLSQAQAPASAAGAVLPEQQTIDNNQILQPILRTARGMPGQGGMTPSGPGFSRGLSPEFLATQVGREVTGDEAARLGVPSRTILTEPMVSRLYQQGVPTAAGRGTILGNGSYPGKPLPAPGPAQPTSAAPIIAPIGPQTSGAGIVTAPSPSASQEFEASTNQYNQASAAANSFRQRTFALEQAAHALENADTGPGSETVNHIKSFLLAQSPDAIKSKLPGVDVSKIQSYDEAVKYLAQYARSQPGAANSDMQTQLAQTANASTHISAAAAQQVVKNTLGLERMQQAALQQFNQTHPEPGSGQQFSRWMTSQFLPNNDPRGFSWDDMSASQRAAQLKNMSAAEKTRLLNSARLSRDLGFRSGS